jgi:hypothetical protein
MKKSNRLQLITITSCLITELTRQRFFHMFGEDYIFSSRGRDSSICSERIISSDHEAEILPHVRRGLYRQLTRQRFFHMFGEDYIFSSRGRDSSTCSERIISSAHEAEILPHVRRGLYLQDYWHFSLHQMTNCNCLQIDNKDIELIS